MLIAEIGNNHFGSMEIAKAMIRAANDSGADLIKAQAFNPEDMVSGSMPPEFYAKVAMHEDEYIELIDYARDLKNDMFYSVIGSGFIRLKTHQNWHKITGNQTRRGMATGFFDHENVIISVPHDVHIQKFKKAELLHVTDYLSTEPRLEKIRYMSAVLDRPVGYSDHTIGIKNCLLAIEQYGAHIVEKHFCLRNDEQFFNQTFRDTVHGVTPSAFQRIAVAMGGIDAGPMPNLS